ncbi:hypothetical protein A2841_03575 [Candidatus Kaiserbacteria bacterium RIFCSPHIGHO2_01_FULL_48_10]|uniref:Uncharacterized protein n=1 Tax=Candidatus Kaiserbacteria bacterium RIFCSPHIGHO2_01_FULL_48_10 TaxID=1798476 RepID=A0A1F6C202_9BACT|nr:MAG: hypothetical protein A2841_03575 [Candidatus Kaiserbacteria bacterium RIFCSPHIGHO2_01_FULL_48_10]
MSFFSHVLFWIVILLCGLLLIGVWLTWTAENSNSQKAFIAGTTPKPALDGFYKGTVGNQQTAWLGKRFDADSASGINVFDGGGRMNTERQPFKTYYGKGLRDKKLNVLVVDYDIPANSFWLRHIRDEIVQIGKDHYLGKLQFRFIGFTFTLGYFELKINED